jgi:hypothetical protein
LRPCDRLISSLPRLRRRELQARPSLPRWARAGAAKAASSLDYAPLPASIVSILDKRLSQVKLGTVGMVK